MKILSTILMGLLFTSVDAIAQTKLETEEWIVSKLNIYSNTGLSLTKPSFQKTARFSISDGKLVGREGDVIYTIDLRNVQDYSYSILDGFKDDDFGNIPPMVSLN